MALTFAQYETLFNDTAIKPRLKALASRRIRNWFKAQGYPAANAEFVGMLARLQVDEFLELIRVDLLGELDDANIATPTAADIATAAVAAIQRAYGNPAL